jgi:pimeloyl-ACP methyl ester carboxylesterase
VALARPDRIASMALYEPSAFHLLARMGAAAAASRAEIGNLVQRVNEGILTGNIRATAAHFVDYWNGAGAWAKLRPSVQAALMRWAPKAPLDFHALINEPEPVSHYQNLRFPVLLLCGENARLPSRAISEHLADVLPDSRLVTVAGAGHMGPLTHATEVSALIVRHMASEPARHAPGRAEVMRLMPGPAGLVS